jgi:hypothetical protein
VVCDDLFGATLVEDSPADHPVEPFHRNSPFKTTMAWVKNSFVGYVNDLGAILISWNGISTMCHNSLASWPNHS